ncbi:UNVERIFIED_CONTAM: hypothetical protein Slati_2168500 [Sesamum latifolium]|uniref:DUF4283 domain-containing protein n=1 Tax=Sesamum latifolium TaxID=2727402 RepID=A0AAW2WSI2_9LAMI
MALCKHSYTEVSVWVRLRHLPMESWTPDGLSTIASGIGRPLYPDAITMACMRLDFARVYVMLDYGSTLPKHLVVVAPQEDGSEVLCRVDIEYEWLLEKCLTCRALRHATSKCPIKKQSIKPLVRVFVQKSATEYTEIKGDLQDICAPPMKARTEVPRRVTSPRWSSSHEAPIQPNNKGKEIVVYNPFNALMMYEDDEVTDGGSKAHSPMEVPP